MHFDKYELIYIFGFIIILIIRGCYQHFNDQSLVEKNYLSTSEILRITGIIILGGIIPIVAKHWVTSANYEPPQWSRYVGIIAMIIAFFIFWRAHKDLDIQFSPTLQLKKDHKLITTGIYKYVRHPMYTSGLFGGIAIVTLLPNYISVLSFFGALAIILFSRIPSEENMMINNFGKEYINYMHNTCRVIPEICKL